MRIYAVQLDIVWEDKQANYQKVISLLDNAQVKKNSLVLLPEMFATGFSMNKETISKNEPAQTENFLTKISHQYHSYILGGLVTLSSSGKGKNICLVCDPSGTTIAHYQKLHPFSYGGESQHYKSGDKITLFDWHEFTVTPFICYDLRFPEIFRHSVVMGTNLFTVIACWPAAREEHWVTLLKARAIENQAYVAGVNRCGSDPKLSYSGRSLIIDPHGNILADGENQEGVIHADVDFQTLSTYRNEFPALSDIRSEYRYE